MQRRTSVLEAVERRMLDVPQQQLEWSVFSLLLHVAWLGVWRCVCVSVCQVVLMYSAAAPLAA